VYITRKGWATDRLSVKLDRQLIGPYRILGMEGHLYIIDLPPYIKMLNVFHAN